MFNALQFLKDHNIPYWTEGKNCQEGWINIQCPFCQDSGNHGGFNIEDEYYNCWKCGHHFLDQVISVLINSTWTETNNIIKQYQNVIAPVSYKRIYTPPLKIHISKSWNTELTTGQKIYLEKRNFDPVYLKKKYSLLNGGYFGDYSFRIIAPIFLNHHMVSYQGRAYHPLVLPKYKACNSLDEVIHHKFIVYNHDNVKNKRAIIVEGITDVWRIGDGAVALFEQSYTISQVMFIVKNYDEVFILFDSDAQESAKKLANHLTGLCRVNIINLPEGVKDPGELSLDDVRILKKDTKI